MSPFVQQIPNQATSVPPRGSAPHQQQFPPGAIISLPPDLMQFQSPMGFGYRHLPPNNNNPNMNMGNVGRHPGGFVNALQQNFHMGNSLSGSVPCPQSFGQNGGGLCFPGNGQPENFVQLNGWQNQFQGQNMSHLTNMMFKTHVAALAQILATQVNPVSILQNTSLYGNPQLCLGQPSGGMQQGNFGQQLPVVSQPLQNIPYPAALSYQQQSQPPNIQMQRNYSKNQGMHTSNSNHHQNKNFVRNTRREASNGRFQKSQDRHRHNAKGKHKSANLDGGTESLTPDNSANPSISAQRRSLSVLYTEKEIQKWREERKKNYPSEINVKKKLVRRQANADAVEEEAKLRSQELKEVLAKQVELGFEVPEIPSHYLLGNKDQCNGKDRNKRPSNNGRLKNRFSKRGRSDKNDRFARKRGSEGNGSLKKHKHIVKRQKVANDDPSKTSLSMRQPTLLQKLLSTDIKRDRSHILQALRFMVMNSFFKDWPEKPLNFPKVIVKETGEGDPSDDNGSENDGPQEEGEITD